MDYITLANSLEDRDVVEDRLASFRCIEKDLIESADTEVRFHSGVPAA
jgi:tRNA-(ms[2]io[6]A)-hydroxylase